MLLAGAPVAAASGVSSPEERKRIVELSKAYESDVLAPDAKERATEIVKWWTDAPDLTVNWCASLLSGEKPASKDLAGAMVVEGIASAGVFVIENPVRASDSRATWIAGLEGIVRAYKQVLAKHEGSKDAFLDKLSDLQAAGKLGEYVDAHSAGCGD